MKKRTCEIKIRLTDEELTELNAKVGQTVFSREEFCRRAITGIRTAAYTATIMTCGGRAPTQTSF